MSHESSGYFYYRYGYHCPYTESNGERKVETGFQSAIYTKVPKQDHKLQAQWRKYVVMPAVQVQIEQRYLPSLDLNRQGRTYDRYNETNVKEIAFKFCPKPPQANQEFAGNELRTAYSR